LIDQIYHKEKCFFINLGQKLKYVGDLNHRA
jgi:hypothetical protein